MTEEKPSAQKNPGGRPRKNGNLRSFYLADDVCAILDAASADKGTGEKTRIVEEAVREWGKKRKIQP